jgi:hypothetical protein
MEQKKFSTKQFHLWPFNGSFQWIGFFPEYSIVVNEVGISLQINGKEVHRLSPDEIEAAHFFSTWFGMGKTKLGLSVEKDKCKEERGDHWHFLSNYFGFVSPPEKDTLISAFKEAHVKCFDETSVSLRDNKLWTGKDFVVEYYKNGASAFWALEIPEIKYFYTEDRLLPLKKPILVTGSDHPLRINKLDSEDVANLKHHILSNGAKLGEISKKTFKHAFSFNVIFKPALWFTSSTIGLGDEGISFTQKTFKTNDNLFLPYEKTNFVQSTGSWYSFTRRLIIYGEQNIIPKRRFSSGDAKRIVNELREKRIGQVEGEEFSESYHSSWIGVLLSIVTLGIWHLITVIFSKKRKSITIGEKKFVWNGELWILYPEEFKREKPKGMNKFFVGDISDILHAYYYKKHWWYLWGDLFIWTHPKNVRLFSFEADQDSVDYDLQMGKIYFWTASSIINAIKKNGFDENEEGRKFYKKWIKAVLANKI